MLSAVSGDSRGTGVPAGATVRLVSADQSRRLSEARLQVTGRLGSRETVAQYAALLASILGAKVAFAVRREEGWRIVGESAPTPSLPGPGAAAWETLDTQASTQGGDVRVWAYEQVDWTLLTLADADCLPILLLLEGDWSLSTPALLTFARKCLSGERLLINRGRSRAGAATHRLSRALSRVTGLTEVCDLVIRHVVRTVPSRLAALAIPGRDNHLSIVATHGYPVALVEDLRIPSGVGVIGSVYRDRVTLHVKDVATVADLGRRRSRYRTGSFVALPITAGRETLGVLCVTDRLDDQAFTRQDVATLRRLVAPTALALAREGVRQQAETFAQAAVIDPVSGLFNRRYFHERLQQELQRAQRHKMPVALLMIDLDDFKGVNDRFGHIAGDTVIRDVSEILRHSVRLFDVCTRFGGEEFAVLMPGSGADSAASIAERIRRRIEEYRPEERPLADLRVTASIGLSVASDVAGIDLLDRADRALYMAKRSGKNRVNTLVQPSAAP
jgi:diguanylate cyclase (GGDEF)-like protein